MSLFSGGFATSFLVVLLVKSTAAMAGPAFPLTPDPRLTQGSLCTRASSLRYPERIRYCARDVSPQEKDLVIRAYERAGGFRIYQMGRYKFKIDHLIPLCMGGSNEMNNLWPQHESLYVLTDPLEALGCQKLSMGRIKQAVLVQMMLQVKMNPSLARQVYDRLNSY